MHTFEYKIAALLAAHSASGHGAQVMASTVVVTSPGNVVGQTCAAVVVLSTNSDGAGICCSASMLGLSWIVSSVVAGGSIAGVEGKAPCASSASKACSADGVVASSGHVHTSGASCAARHFSA